MKKVLLGLTVLTTIFGCSKDNGILPQEPWTDCGSFIDTTWPQYVTVDSLVGNWTVSRIWYSNGNGPTTTLDTTYLITAPLTLNANGTGTIYSTPLFWSLYTSGNSLPILTITKLDTLFPFPVNFIYNDTASTYLQSPPHTQPQGIFYIKAGGSGVQWEWTHLAIERQ